MPKTRYVVFTGVRVVIELPDDVPTHTAYDVLCDLLEQVDYNTEQAMYQEMLETPGKGTEVISSGAADALWPDDAEADNAK